MYKVFKSEYLIKVNTDSLIQIVSCDLNCTSRFRYRGNYRSDDDTYHVDIYTNSISYPVDSISDPIPLSYKEVFDLINRKVIYLDDLKDCLYKALLFYDECTDCRFKNNS